MAISALVAAVSTGVAVGTAAIAGTAFTFAGLAGFAAVAASFAVGTAMGAALNALAPKPNMSQTRGFGINGESGAALDHQIIYGERRVGGARVYDSTTGAENKYLHRILAYAGHEIDSYVSIYLNDEIVTINTTTNMVTSPARYANLVRIKRYYGTPGQTADANLVSETTGLVDGAWTTNHRLRGIAYLYIRFEYSQDAYPNGIPAVSAVIRGKKLYDPRKDITSPVYNASLGVTTHRANNPTTWQYSNLSSLCLRDYIASDYGLNQPGYRIDDTLVASASVVCSQTVDGEPRYTCNGAFLTSTEPAAIINDLISSMGGLFWYSAGQWHMKPGAWTAPSVSFDEDDIRGGIQVSTRHSRRENFNAVRGVFAGIETEWEFTDYPLVRDNTPATSIQSGLSYTIVSVGTTNFTAIGASSNTVGVTFVATGVGTGTGTVDAYLGSDNGLPNVMDLPLKFTTTSKSAQRLARLVLNRNREQLTISVNLNMRGFLIGVGDVIQMSNTRFGWSNKTFEVVAWNFGIADDLSLYTSVTLRELTESVFAAVNGAVLELNNTTLPSPFRSTAPATLTLSSSVGFAADGSYVTQIVASWSASSDSFVNQYEIQWKKSTDATYFSALVEDLSYAIPSALNNTQYNVRVRAINIYGYRGAFIAQSITVGKDLTPPALPTTITATGAFGYIAVQWTNPADLDFSHIQVWENTTNNSATSTQIATAFGTSFVRANLDPGVTRWYFLKSVDSSGNVSAFTAGTSGTTVFVDNNDFTGGIYSLFTAQGLYAIRDVTALPLSGAFIGEKVYNRTDGKLYQWNGTAWSLVVAAVNAPDISGQLVTAQIAVNAITSSLIATNAITETKISSDAITSPKIAAGAITTAKLAAGAVTANEIAADSITSAKIVAGTIQASDIATGTITATQIAANTITGDRIVANTITGGLLAASGVITNSAQINNAVIQSANIQNLAVGRIKIANGAITNKGSIANSWSFSQPVNTGVYGSTSFPPVGSFPTTSFILIGQQTYTVPADAPSSISFEVGLTIVMLYSLLSTAPAANHENGWWHHLRIEDNSGNLIQGSTYALVQQFQSNGYVVFTPNHRTFGVQVPTLFLTTNYVADQVLTFKNYFYRYRSSTAYGLGLNSTGGLIQYEEFYK
jgi:hypothetical protein